MIDPNIVAYAALRARNDALRSARTVEALQKEISEVKRQAEEIKRSNQELEKKRIELEQRQIRDEQKRSADLKWQTAEQERLRAEERWKADERRKAEMRAEVQAVADKWLQSLKKREPQDKGCALEEGALRATSKATESSTGSNQQVTGDIERVACPRCGEMIAKTATICRYCRTELAPTGSHKVRYFCFVGGEVIGPYVLAQLASMRAARQIDERTLCCLEGTENWFVVGALGT